MQWNQQIEDWLNAGTEDVSFREELERVGEQLRVREPGAAMQQYLSMELPSGHAGGPLRSSDDELDQLLSPEYNPLGKWPDNPRKVAEPVTQAEINRVIRELAEKKGLVSVSQKQAGEKRQLLKEIVAHNLVKRAEQLITYTEPNHAFTFLKSVGTSKVYALDPKLTGFGTVVVSADDGELRAMAKELSAEEAIDDVFRGQRGCRYYKHTAEQLHPYSCWGLLSALPGHTVTGQEQIFTGMQEPDGAGEEKAPPSGVGTQPTQQGEEAARERWSEACKAFQAALSDVQSQHSAIVQSHKLNVRRAAIQEDIARLELKRDQVGEYMDELRDQLQHCYRKSTQTAETIESLKQDMEWSRGKSFALTAKLLGLKPYREHMDAMNKLHLDISALYSTMSRHKNDISSLEAKIANELAYQSKLDHKLELMYKESGSMEEQIPQEIRQCSRGSRSKELLAAPWITESYNRARSNLFLAAMDVHECFIRAASSRMIGNTALLGQLASVDRETVKPLWDAFTLVVPVITASLASISSLFRGIGQEELGWLFVDRDSLPCSQAAVGPVWRSRKTVMVSS